MILIDTNVIVDLWKNPSDKAKDIIRDNEVCICGVIRSELLHGAYSERNLEEISRKLDLLEEINIKDNQWDRFGRFLYKLRTNGVSLPYADAIIAFTAITNDVIVLTRDKHFRLIKEVFPQLQLYKE